MSDLGDLHAKVAVVMDGVGHIPKRGHNAAQNYDYAMESDVLDSVRPELAKLSVSVRTSIEKTTLFPNIASTRNGSAQHMALVEGWMIFGDGATGEEIRFGIAGCGIDSGDKMVPKAITMAVKYGLLKTFLIPTGEEVDDAPAEEAVRPATTIVPSGDAYPWESAEETAERLRVETARPETAPAMPRSAPPRAGTRRLITDKQQKLVFGRSKGLGLSDDERDNVIQQITGQPRIDGIAMDDMDALVEALTAYSENKQ